MASKPINVVIKGEYSDKDVKRAIRDLQSLEKQAPRTGTSMKKVAGGFGLAAAAVGVLAVKLGTDGVKAFMEDEAAAAKLARTMRNLGFGAATAQAEAWIDNMQFATGVADDQLRPALSQAMRATNDLGDAQDMVSLAMDIAAGTGKDLSAVMLALVKASNGQVSALTRLGIPLDAGIVKSKDYGKAAAELARIFRGQASDAANTLAGKMNRLNVGVGELQESLGKGITEGFFGDLDQGTESVDAAIESLREAQGTVEALGRVGGEVFRDLLGWARDFGRGAMGMAYAADAGLMMIVRASINARDALGLLSDEEADAQRASLDAQDAAWQQAMANYDLQTSGEAAAAGLDGLGRSAGDAGDGLDGAADSADDAAKAFNAATASADDYKTALDKLNGKNINVGRSRIELERELGEGPRKGKDGRAEMDDVKMWAYDVADQAMDTAQAYFDRGGKGDRKRGRDVLADTRRRLIRELGKYGIRDPEKFVRRILSTPQTNAAGRAQQEGGAPLGIGPQARDEGMGVFGAGGFGGGEFDPRPWWDQRPGPAPTPAPGPVGLSDYERASKSGTTTIRIDRVEVQSPVAWDQMVKEAQRRVRASGGRFTYPASVTR